MTEARKPVEDDGRCRAEVWREDWRRLWNQGRCTRKSGHGHRKLYCKQHAKRLEYAAMPASSIVS